MEMRRPEDKYWNANGVFPGQCDGYISPDDQIVPVYAVAYIPPGLRGVFKGDWRLAGGTLTLEYRDARVHWSNQYAALSRGEVAAVALVALIGHPQPGDDLGIVLTVCDVSASSAITGTGEFVPLPGLHTLRDVVVAAFRKAANLDPEKFVRPEPARPFNPAQDVPDGRTPTDDGPGEEFEPSGEPPHSPVNAP